MNKLALALLFTMYFVIGNSQVSKLNLIPQPQKIEMLEGDFSVNSKFNFHDEFNNDESKLLFKMLMRKIQYIFQNEVDDGNKPVEFSLLRDVNIENEEGYRLIVKPSKITILAKNEKGIYYGFMTLFQLIDFNTVNYSIPCLQIDDYPAFQYRGLHLDVSRHFAPVEFVKEYIDLMSQYKFNYFHWHLTDDQGWRIEIKKYPKLTSIGAFRDSTMEGRYYDIPRRFDNNRYGGYYTQDDIREIVDYAKLRNVEIIPEIEMPGHSRAALAAYPELACTDGPFSVMTMWGVSEDVFCPTDSTFKFLENVLSEVFELFPSKYIHIGGDEVLKNKWRESAFCQDLMKKEKLKNEEELQSYFIKRIEKFINSRGKIMIGWDEILEGGLAPNAIVMSWRGEEGGIEAARSESQSYNDSGSILLF
ncbi:MAG: beta-N-acetylhexosaminidase [Saprospiraceae bacterium]